MLVGLLSVFLIHRSAAQEQGVNIDNPEVTARVLCRTTAGDLDIEVYAEWAPLGAARFLQLVKDRFYTDIAMYRSQPNFLTQFGISDNPKLQHYHGMTIQDDPNLHIPIKTGYMSFAGGGPNTRSSQSFIAFASLDFLGKEPWETPYGRVLESSFGTLDKIYKGYPEIVPFSNGPDQQRLFKEGNSYIRDNYPLTTFIQSCKIVADKVELTSEDHHRELTEAPFVVEKPVNLRVNLEKPQRRTFTWKHIAVGSFLFCVLIGIASYRPRPALKHL